MELKDFKLFETISKSLFDGAESIYEKGIAFIDALAPICSLAFGVYILLQVFHYHNKGFDEPLLDISKRLVGWLIVIALAFNAHNIKTIGKIGWNLPDSMASVVMSEKFDGQLMDGQVRAISKQVVVFEQKRDEMNGLNPANWGPYLAITGVLYTVFICALLLSGVAFAFYVLAKMLLLIALTFAPLFLASLLFPATRQWGTNWIQTILNYSLTITAYVIVGIMQQTFVSKILVKLFEDLTGGDLMTGLLFALAYIVGTMVIFCIIIWNVPSLIMALIGGAQFSSHASSVASGARVGGRVGAAGAKLGLAAGALALRPVGKGFGAIRSMIGNSLGKG